MITKSIKYPYAKLIFDVLGVVLICIILVCAITSFILKSIKNTK